MGGLSGVLISFETGQTKVEWYLKSFPISISIGISVLSFQSDLSRNPLESNEIF